MHIDICSFYYYDGIKLIAKLDYRNSGEAKTFKYIEIMKEKHNLFKKETVFLRNNYSLVFTIANINKLLK